MEALTPVLGQVGLGAWGSNLARNFGELRSLLHAMKGSSASMGTDRLTKLCGDFGKLSDSQLRLRTADLVRVMGEELGRVKHEFDQYLKDRRQSTG